MEIIKQGSIELAYQKRRQVRLFWCEDCGCLFKAGNDEYKYVDNGSFSAGDRYCECPCCGKPDVYEGSDPSV